MSSLDRSRRLSPRHLAVRGILRLTPQPTAEAIAHELHFTVEEVNRLLEDLQMLDGGDPSHAGGDNASRGRSPR